MAQVIIAPSADADTDGILADLATQAGWRTAAKYDQNFDRLYVRLSEHPAIGAPRSRLGRNISIGIVSPYIIIYRYDKASGMVTVLRIVHERRRITRGLLSVRS